MSEEKKNSIGIRKFGKTGIYVSELCFGCMTIGSTEKSNYGLSTASGKEESFQLMDEYSSRGGFFFDTADAYGAGDSEIVLGEWMKKQKRDDLVIATKFFSKMGTNVNSQGGSRKHIANAITSSLDRMKTDYVDIYQIHLNDPETTMEETFRTLNDLVRVGKIHYIGVSNFTGAQLQKAVDVCKYMGLEDVVSLQAQYSLLCRSTEWDLLEICKSNGLGCLPWSPLAGGWLSGRYTRELSQPPEGSRVAWAQQVGWQPTGWELHANEFTWKIIDELQRIGKEVERSPAQVALRWLMQRPGVTAPIIGAKNMKQLVDNLETTTFKLSDEQMEALNQVSFKVPPYPWDVLSRPARR